MDFENNVPDWLAEGTEPPESLKKSGFTAGYKPPAAFFNWFWNRVSKCLTEIRTKLSGHADDKNNPHKVTAVQLGLDKVNNTPDSEKNVAFASEAATARKVNYNMVVRFNGGSTESTDMFTYNGSTSRSVNITPDKISAAEKDLSNVDDAVFYDKAVDAGAFGIPVVDADSTDGVAYTATVKGISALSNGLMITIVPKIASTSTAVTLNVNNTGAKILRLPLSFNNAAMSAPKNANFFTAGRPITVQYDANYTTGGAWKTIGKQKTSAQDLYGTVPIESGGTGATTVDEAREALVALKRGSYERIEGTSTAKKDLNNYITAGFYNVKTVNVNNCPEGVGVDAALLIYPWNDVNGYMCQELTETAASTMCRRWLRHMKDASGTWTNWVRVYTTDAPPTYSEVGAAPASHTSAAATGSVLGHVKLSDSTSSTSAASAGIAASPKAVKDAYDKAVAAASAASTAKTTADGKAPKAHASTATTYGIGTSANYGHVKLSDAVNSTSAAASGIAASPKAVKTAYDIAAAAIPKVSGATEGHIPTFKSDGSVASSGIAMSSFTRAKMVLKDGILTITTVN